MPSCRKINKLMLGSNFETNNAMPLFRANSEEPVSIISTTLNCN